MIPHRVYDALMADGWFGRADIVWAKKNPMPESVRDRPTKSHEYIFLLTKNARYFWDADAVKERAEYGSRPGTNFARVRAGDPRDKRETEPTTVYGGDPTTGRNIRSVWTIATHAFSAAHFATFPPELAERCIKAGTSEKGACNGCGAPWTRVVERETVRLQETYNGAIRGEGLVPNGVRWGGSGVPSRIATETTGWEPSCTCDADIVPCVTLDPFSGAGTVALVADRLGRDSINIELNDDYVAMARTRVTDDCPMFADVS